MSHKLKALGLGLLAAMAISAFAVMSAAAEDGGHFTSEVDEVVVTGTENATHFTTFAVTGLTGIVCTKASYSGLVNETDTTAEGVTVTPKYEECHTEDEAQTPTPVHTNGCDYLFTVSKNSQKHNTVHLKCPGVKKFIDITHPSCTLTIPEQTINGVVYKTTFENGKHAITLESTASVTTHFESGICVLLGTKQTGTLSGAVTVTGKSTAGAAVGITATGSEG